MGLVDPDLPDIVMAIVLSTAQQGDPAWLYLSGASGSGKTEILRAFSGPKIRTYTGFTSNALLSGFVTRDAQGNRTDNSMLAELNNKTLVIKDMSQLLGLPRDQRMKIFGILRDAYDGDSSMRFGGPQQTLAVRSHFSCIAATTQQIELSIEQEDKAYGERFLTLKPRVRSRLEHIEHALRMADRAQIWREELREAVEEFLEVATPPTSLADINTNIQDLAIISDFCSAARSPVVRNKYRQDTVEAPPELEYGTRLSKQLLKIGKNVAWLGGNYQRSVKRIALSSIPIVRKQILEAVYKYEHRTVAQLMEDIQVSERVIRQECENLNHLGVLERMIISDENGKKGRMPHSYLCAPPFLPGMAATMSDKWMGLNDSERADVEEHVCERPAPPAGGDPFDPDNFWPGDE
jgi:energy-coupling factor transporter ATP-binding protein EcfA2